MRNSYLRPLAFFACELVAVRPPRPAPEPRRYPTPIFPKPGAGDPRR